MKKPPPPTRRDRTPAPPAPTVRETAPLHCAHPAPAAAEPTPPATVRDRGTAPERTTQDPGAALSAPPDRAGPPPAMPEFRGWQVSETFDARGGEADIYLIERAGERRVLKLYRQGICPRPEVLAQLLEITREHPQRFVRVDEHGFDSSWRRYFEIQEFCTGGTLRDLLGAPPTAGGDSLAAPQLSEAELTDDVLPQLCAALSALHKHGVLHLDLKPANILVRQRHPLDLVVTDFGVASLLADGFTKKFTEVKGTSLYQSPESLAGIVGPASDWWALGIIVLEALLGRHPLEGLSRQVVFFHLTTRSMPIPANLDPRWRQLLRGLLTRDPDHRWTDAEVARWRAGEFVAVHDEAPPAHGGSNTAQPDPALGATVRRMALPYTFANRDHDTLEALVAAMMATPETWTQATRQLAHGYLVKWLEDNHDYDRAAAITALREQHGDNGDAVLFRIALRYCPEQPPRWRGFSLDRSALVPILLEAVTGTLDDDRAHLLEHLLAGTLSRLAAAEQAALAPETAWTLYLADSLHRAEPGRLPTAEVARLLWATFSGIFEHLSPLAQLVEQQRGERNAVLLFAMLDAPGFAAWLQQERVLAERPAALWMLALRLVTPVAAGVVTAATLATLARHEDCIYTLLQEQPEGGERLWQLLSLPTLSRELIEWLGPARVRHPWLTHVLIAHWQLDEAGPIDRLEERHTLYVSATAARADLQTRLVPPELTRMLSAPFSLHRDIEQYGAVIREPALLPSRGTAGLSTWAELQAFLARHGIALPSTRQADPWRRVGRLLTTFLELKRAQAAHQGLNRSWEEIASLFGAGVAALALFGGLATLPALATFGIAWTYHSRARRQRLAEIATRMQHLGADTR